MTATRVALGLAALGDVTFTEALDLATGLGFRAFDIQLDSTLAMTRSLPADPVATAELLARELSAHDAEIVCVSNVRDAELLLGPYGQHTDAVRTGDRPAKIRHARAAARHAIDVAAALRCRHVRLYFGCPDHLLMFPWHGLPLTWRHNVERMVEAIAGLLDHAADRGVTVCVEPHPRQVVFDLPSLLDARSLLAETARSIGLCLDPANLAAGGIDPYSYVYALPEPPQFVHMKDVEFWSLPTVPPGPGWKHYGRGRPVRFRNTGSGSLEWPRLRDSLVDIGFTGVAVVEFEDLMVNRSVGLARARAATEELFAAPGTEAQWW
ncbi:sugar phosphate isomerase/epimerase [Dactylosporangium roseum]|uniref:Sugar phosphate isomerase/epimerase n=1 Tax=Dactylosporangium roseum TaxID=47989 RepID=A0ABY5Z2I3_9ACTN|nr:sugar phosphate isomerase/epimerase [Dactylosporangium roseum]UWZ35869.1 sugar phosphate isomerase/epimerase [Dactylosporangium roseum]